MSDLLLKSSVVWQELIELVPQVRRWERQNNLPAELEGAEVPKDVQQRSRLEEWFLGSDLDSLDLSGIPLDELEYVLECVRDMVKIRHARLLRTILRRCPDTWKLVVLEAALAEPQLETPAHKLIDRLGSIGTDVFSAKHRQVLHSCVRELSVAESRELLDRCVSASLVDRLPVHGRTKDIQRVIESDSDLASFFAADPNRAGWLDARNKTQRLPQVFHGAIRERLELHIDTLHRDRTARKIVSELRDPRYGKNDQVRQELRANWGTRLMEACYDVPAIERKMRESDQDFASELYRLSASELVPTSLNTFLLSHLSFTELSELWWESDRVRRRDQRRIDRSDELLLDIDFTESSSAEEKPMPPPDEVMAIWLSQLTDRQKEVVDLFYFKEQSIAKIASMLGSDQSSIQERWDRAGAKLSTILNEWAESEL